MVENQRNLCNFLNLDNAIFKSSKMKLLADTILRFGGSLAPQCQHQIVTETNLVFEKISTHGMIQRRTRF